MGIAPMVKDMADAPEKDQELKKLLEKANLQLRKAAKNLEEGKDPYWDEIQEAIKGLEALGMKFVGWV